MDMQDRSRLIRAGYSNGNKPARHGPCIICGLSRVEYLDSVGRDVRDNQWIHENSEQFKRSITVKFLHDDPSLFMHDVFSGNYWLNEHNIDDLYGYTCIICLAIHTFVVVEATRKTCNNALFFGVELSRIVETGVLDFITYVNRNTSKSDKASLAKMPYHDYLQTEYWHAVRCYARILHGNKCFFGCKRNSIHVHHKTYEHRGYELDYIDDLVVFCDACHAKYHDKYPAK